MRAGESAGALLDILLRESHKPLDIVDDKFHQRIGAFLEFRVEIRLLNFFVIVILLALLTHEINDSTDESQDGAGLFNLLGAHLIADDLRQSFEGLFMEKHAINDLAGGDNLAAVFEKLVKNHADVINHIQV